MSGKVLIVDDETIVSEILEETLEFEDIEACSTDSGEKALELLEKDQYAILIVDVNLGGIISGIDIVKKCREKKPHPTIFVISGSPRKILDPLFQKENIQDQIEDVLEKPSGLTPDQLIPRLKKILENSHE